MEKNQHNHKENTNQQTPPELPEQAPGQQVPSNESTNKNRSTEPQQGEEWHSESSLPQNDNETLGTP